ncbi:2-oxo-4-hydroxy-4-carboxy-5-ureidoimidazoline decarboxylase [Nocardioides sp.]|uniref:2-oxo-4-hydroxy-4-carboxy-5-ureidoimidazoline decarboxylase n=1 Tax=Nocardioides sp. TaxID=35761 RepID=UPI00262907D1|nr:2-oxo-4-hydroxy-4-carboxy-5-ureidoimidazoline decarboxylase [Nocardioides sp.]
MSSFDDFNTASAAVAEALIAPCVAIGSFAREVVADRPYADLGALLERARIQVSTWTDAEVEGALADHPRIGQRHRGEGASAAMSHAEQADLGLASATLAARLEAGNAAYEERFGRIYLVRAAGRTAEELLALLEQRLTNDPTTELAVTASNLGEIALRRLEGLFT